MAKKTSAKRVAKKKTKTTKRKNSPARFYPIRLLGLVALASVIFLVYGIYAVFFRQTPMPPVLPVTSANLAAFKQHPIHFEFYKYIPDREKLVKEQMEVGEQLQQQSVQFVIHSGLFSQLQRAFDYQAALKGQGFSTAIIPIAEQGKTYYRIQLGVFGTEQAAFLALQQLQAQGYSGTLLAFTN